MKNEENMYKVSLSMRIGGKCGFNIIRTDTGVIVETYDDREDANSMCRFLNKLTVKG